MLMPCEFSLTHYEEILEQMKGRAGTATERKEIILTHDVDILPKYALQLALLEHHHNIRATYYVLLHSDWYNALSPENMKIWREIKSLGHELALHYDGNYDQDLAAVHRAFCSMVGTESLNISQHLVGITPDLFIPNKLNDRSRLVKAHDYKYIADSGGWWRNGCICNHLKEGKRLLAVLHPVWWIHGQNPFGDVVADACDVIHGAEMFWVDLVNEHRKQQKQTVQIQARSA